MDGGHCIARHRLRLYPVGHGEPWKSFKAEIMYPLPCNIIPISHNIKFSLRVIYGDSAVWKLLDKVWGVGRWVPEDIAAIRQVNALGKMSAIATGTKNWATNSAKALRKRTPRTIIMGLLHAITMRGFWHFYHISFLRNHGNWHCDLSFIREKIWFLGKLILGF